MATNGILPLDGPENIPSSESLPIFVAKKWGFPLQFHEVDDTTLYSIKDWLAGLTGSNQASHMWANYRERHPEHPLPSREMVYIAENGQAFTLAFTTDEGLYKLAMTLRITRNRPALRAIKDFLARAGVFVDEARRDPETAAEKLALIHRRQAIRRGKSEEWIATREEGKVTRKQFVRRIYALVRDKRVFGPIIAGITNEVYRGTFGSDTKGLRERLGITTKENPRDHFSRLALAYTTIAEESIRIHLGQYGEGAFVPVPVIYEVVSSIAAGIGIQTSQLAKALQIDIVSGQKLVEAPLTQKAFEELLRDSAQPIQPKSRG
jgi:hypothetical protein